MAVSITTIERNRKKFLRESRPQVREIITASNKLLRDLDRTTKRVRAVPEEKDLERFLGFCGDIFKELEDVVKRFEGGYIE